MWGKGKGLISKRILLRLNNQRKKWKVLYLLPGLLQGWHCYLGRYEKHETPLLHKFSHPNEKPRNQKKKRHFLHLFLSSRENWCRYFLEGKLRILWRHLLFHSQLSLTWPVCFTAPRQCHHHSRESKMMSRSSSHIDRWPPEVYSSLSYSVSIDHGSEASLLV